MARPWGLQAEKEGRQTGTVVSVGHRADLPAALLQLLFELKQLQEFTYLEWWAPGERQHQCLQADGRAGQSERC